MYIASRVKFYRLTIILITGHLGDNKVAVR